MLRFNRAALSAMLCVAFTASQALTVSAAEHRQFFKVVYGGFAVTTAFDPTAKPPYIKIHGSAAGNDPLLGLSIAAFDQTVVFSSPNQIKDGRFVFTAGDGSTLAGTYQGPASVPDARGLTAGRGTFLVTGGAGRFRGVHGRGCYTVFAQLFAPGSTPVASVQTTFEGEIER